MQPKMLMQSNHIDYGVEVAQRSGLSIIRVTPYPCFRQSPARLRFIA